MKSMEFIKGDFKISEWSIEDDKLVYGTFKTEELPISEITSIKTLEIIRKKHFIELKFSTGQYATATMDSKTYEFFYTLFVKNGNKSKRIKLPITGKSEKNIFWTIGGAFVLISYVLSGSNDNPPTPNSSSTQSTNTSSISAESCIANINAITMYDIPRFRTVSKSNYSVQVSYTNYSGKVHQFKCENGKIQLFAEGAGIWMDM
ncbi:hypothetical protein ACROAE_18895 [Shewanella sp. MF05960]|uniref:hypothetical protein n=1 Tax=Shewanella sp. MF05960 TaxID=3434874 RepID=UPI003D79792D